MTRSPRRGARLPGGLALAAAFGALLVVAPPAQAHSGLLRSDPPSGGRAEVGRHTLSLWFSEPISTETSRFSLVSLDGKRMTAAATVSSQGDRAFVQLETAPLPRSTYRLEWSVSAVDGHTSSGATVFGVGVRPVTGPSDEEALPKASLVAIRWVELAALMLVIGALTVFGLVLRSLAAPSNELRGHALYLGALAAGVAAFCGVITPFLRAPHDRGSVISWIEATRTELTDTSWGRLWSVREAALVLAAVLLWAVAARGRSERRLIPFAVAAVTIVVVLESWVGHASALPRHRGLAIAASASHLAAAGVWAGGLTVLAVCLLPLMRQRDEQRRRLLTSVWRRFSSVAVVATVVLIATGLYASGRQVPDLASIRSTMYGGAIGVKLALLGLALAVAGLNTLCVNPRPAALVARALGKAPGWTPVPARHFSKAVLAELAVLFVAVGVAAVLTSVTPAREIAAASRTSGPVVANVDGTFVSFEDAPADEDASLLIVRARSTVKPEPEPIDGVEVFLDGPGGVLGPIPLEPVEPGRYEAPTVSLTAGTWLTTVAVHRGGLPAAVARVDWKVPNTATERATPLEWVTSIVAALLLASTIGALGLLARKRRPRPLALDLAGQACPASRTTPSET